MSLAFGRGMTAAKSQTFLECVFIQSIFYSWGIMQHILAFQIKL